MNDDPPIYYVQSIRSLELQVTSMLRAINKLSGHSLSLREMWIPRVFGRMCIQSFSLLKLLPYTQYCSKEAYYFSDWSAIASQSRSIMDTFLLYAYMGFDPVEDEEWDARLTSLNIHASAARRKRFNRPDWNGTEPFYMREPQQIPEPSFEEKEENFRKSLKDNNFFKNLPISDKERSRFLRGSADKFLIQDEILIRIGRDKDDFRWWYNYLSSYIHTFPISVFQFEAAESGKGFLTDFESTSIFWCLEMIRDSYLEPSEKMMMYSFKDVYFNN